MLQRKALKQFQAWHDAPSHTALLVTGARQVGKTYLIREFADQHYESFAEFNFIQNPDAARIFNPPSDAATMLMRMELASGQRFIPGKTLIFLDEMKPQQPSNSLWMTADMISPCQDLYSESNLKMFAPSQLDIKAK